MNNRKFPLLVIFLACLLLLLIQVQTVRADDSKQFQDFTSSLLFQLPGESPIPTPELRVLPAVGGNAGLVLGGSVLVLIIIGGVVLTARRRSKH